MAFKKVKKEDSFAFWFINEFGADKFNSLINHEKNLENNIDIWSISKRSTAILWFKCENKEYHEFALSADKYNKGNRCKYCGRTKYVHPLDSFGQYMIDNYDKNILEKIWSNKNEKSPFKYKIGSEQKVHFNCYECGDYMGYSQIKNYIVSTKKCDKCKKKTSSLHQKVLDYLRSKEYSINTEYSCSILPINPLTKYPLPYDIELVNYNLIIEVHGKQHYSSIGENSKWLNGLTSAEYLAKRKNYDIFKKDFALKNNFHFLEIPYWTEQKEEYKILIDKKIEEVIKSSTPTTTDTREHHFG